MRGGRRQGALMTRAASHGSPLRQRTHPQVKPLLTTARCRHGVMCFQCTISALRGRQCLKRCCTLPAAVMSVLGEGPGDGAASRTGTPSSNGGHSFLQNGAAVSYIQATSRLHPGLSPG
jgi:hypothetical protein